MLRRPFLPAVAVLLLAACSAEQKPEATVEPTAPKAAPSASVSAAPALTVVDTTAASSVCRTVVRQRAAAAKQVEINPSTAESTTELAAQVSALDAIVADVCQ